MKTPVILCADDYALTPGISRAIRDLADRGRLSATSVMTVSPYWEDEGPALRDLASVRSGRVSAGLHFTLTDLKPLMELSNLAPGGRFPGLGTVLRQAVLRRISPAEIAQELNAQIDRFEAVWGGPPAYLDGHHHVHQLPVVRDAVLDIARRRLGAAAYLRLCDEPATGIWRRGISVPRAIVISLLGRNFARRARAAGLRGNVGFRGVRDFDPSEDVARLFEAYLTGPQANMMIMCHPGFDEAADGIDDDIHSLRPAEYDYLKSDAFGDLMTRRDVTLVPPTEAQ